MTSLRSLLLTRSTVDRMNPTFKRIAPLPPPRWALAIFLIVSLFVMAAALYVASLPVIRSLDAEAIPGADGTELAYLPDVPATSQMTFPEVLAREQDFKILTDPTVLPVMNKVARNVRWFRLRISNRELSERRVILDLIWRVYDHITLYQRNANGDWTSVLAGSTVSATDPLLSRRKSAFELTLPPERDVTFYLRTQDYYRLPTQFQLWPNVDDFIQWEIFDYAKGFGYFALWLGMVATGLFLYAMVRERSQLYFVLFAFFIGALNVISTGTLWLLRPWPGWPLGEVVVAAFGALALFFLCLFARHFLRLPEDDPSLDRVIRVTQWFTLIILLSVSAVFFPQYGLVYLQGCFAVGFLVIAMLIFASVRRWYAGHGLAPFFLLAFTPYVVAMAVRFRAAQDYFVRDDESRVLSLMANALTLIFLSFAAAYRHRVALAEKQQLQMRYQDELVLEVAQRTEDLTVLTERLREALSERHKVMAIIGHDLRSPTATLHSLTQIITQWPGTMDSEELKQHAERIEQACERQLELLHNLMEWGNSHSQHIMIPSRIRENVEKAWQLMELTSSEKKLRFELAIDPELTIATVPRIFQTVIRNLLANAIKFTPKDGLIRVSASLIADGQVEVRIQDSGIGIPPDRLEKLTRDLVESSAGTEGETGAGIGLKLSYELAISLGATLKLESQSGRGTEAIFTVPSSSPNGSEKRESSHEVS